MSIAISWSKEVVELLSIEGFDPDFGARPIKRTVRYLIENNISDKILKNEIKEGNTINLSVKEKEIYFGII